jgi:hypothetical protein
MLRQERRLRRSERSERRPPLSIVALILAILGLGFLAVLWVSIAMSLVFLVRGGMARTHG